MSLEHVPRKDNQQENVLARLASVFASLNSIMQIPVYQNWVVPPLLDDDEDIYDNDRDDIDLQHVVNAISTIEEEDWHLSIIDYLAYGILPSDAKKRSDIRRCAPRFVYFNQVLYRRSFEGVLLCCLVDDEVKQTLEEVHSGICRAH